MQFSFWLIELNEQLVSSVKVHILPGEEVPILAKTKITTVVLSKETPVPHFRLILFSPKDSSESLGLHSEATQSTTAREISSGLPRDAPPPLDGPCIRGWCQLVHPLLID